MAFGADGKLYQKVQSSLTQDSTGIGATWTSLIAGGTASTSPSVNMIPASNASGTIKATWIATSTTNYQFLRSTSTGAYWADISGNPASTTATRALAAIYHNITSTSPLLINFTASLDCTGGTPLITCSVSADNSTYVTVGVMSVQQVAATGVTMNSTFIVPRNWYYKCVASGGGSTALVNWVETTL
jgi:hypothetical protein